MDNAITIELSKDNIVEYLAQRTNLINNNDTFEVKELSSGDTDPEQDGYVNFIFRVCQNGNSYIVKQSRKYLRRQGIVDNLPAERNYKEYLSYLLRSCIDEKNVPQVYYVDIVNNVFVMEDLQSQNMRLMRFQLNEGREFVNFPKQIATFMAYNHFYTSELFLDKELFRDMQMSFANIHMRSIMEDQVMLKHIKDDDSPLNYLGNSVWADPELRLELLKVRDTLIRKGECLIHGDLHTSNLFVDAENTRVIDMEYSFVAPFSYDIGYLLANFISQYAAFMFNSQFDNAKRESFQQYLLGTIRQVLDSYFDCFRQCFEAAAKPIYRDTPGYLDAYLFPDILYEALGFMAAANMMRIINLSPFPDFDALSDPTDKLLAQGFSVAIDEYILRNREDIKSPAMLIDGIVEERRKYLKTTANAK